ncbi:hypothetical protein KKH18_03595, partial [bacterium]|nr:hypothetical protein [bacterium]
MKATRVLYLLFCFIIAIQSSEVHAGVGARHFMEGALFSKYLTKKPKQSRASHIETYASAFFVGMISHGISDHIGNYEPHSDDPEYYYFIGEGIAGCALLYPQWREDPRLFYGSMGGVFPDIDQMEPFGRKFYPTHSGEIPHFRLRNFWRGVVLNLTINGLAYYAIRNELFTDEGFRSQFSVGYSVGYWNSMGARKRGVEGWPSGENGYPNRRIHILYCPEDFLTLNLGIGDWMRDIHGESTKDYPPRLNLDSYTLCTEFHPRTEWRILPYGTFGLGLYTASISGAVDEGSISFSTHEANTLG